MAPWNGGFHRRMSHSGHSTGAKAREVPARATIANTSRGWDTGQGVDLYGLEGLFRCCGQVERHGLFAEPGVLRGEANAAGFFSGTDPDGACATDEGERIVADQRG